MKRILCAFLAVLLFCCPVFADTAAAGAAVEAYIAALDGNGLAPGYAGGEWAVLAAARSESKLPDGFFDGYYKRLCDTLEANGGVLSERKYTEYSRTIIALTAIGKDPRDTAGYDLLERLADFDAVKKQGVNGSIYALIALDCGNYTIPRHVGGTQATRALYIQHILSAQQADGGFALTGSKGDADMTAMALQALSKHGDTEGVNESIERALVWLSENQLDDGGYATVGEETCESTAQVLAALCELGIDADTDPRFIKNGHSIADSILSFKTKGGFRHTGDAEAADPIATEQAVYALVSYIRTGEGKTPLYKMTDRDTKTAAAILEWAAAFAEWRTAH